MALSNPTIDTVRELATIHMMSIEAIIADIYQQLCQGESGYALFDGGAHIGYHTIRMGALKGCEAVYAIDADPKILMKLRAVLRTELRERATGRLKNNQDVNFLLIPLALQRDANVTFVDWKSSMSHVGRSSMISTKGQRETIWDDNTEIEYSDPVRIAATTIDRILEAESRPLPFMKLDLEGADIASLFGAHETLLKKRPIIVFENSIHSPKVHAFTIEAFFEYVSKLSYVPLNFVGERLTVESWFSFFEAWLVPAELENWLSTMLPQSVAREINKRAILDREKYIPIPDIPLPVIHNTD